MNFAILCNSGSASGSSRPELIKLLHKHGERVFLGGILEDKVNPFFGPDTAEFMPVYASRGNTNPISELKSIRSISKQVRKNSIDAAIVYGVKNHAAMAIGARLGGCKKVLCVVNGSGNLFLIPGFKGKLLRAVAFTMLRIAYRRSIGVCFQNEDDKQLFLDKKLVKPSEKLFCSNGSGVNLEKFPEQDLPAEPRFLFLSRITATKGIKEYIEAARIVKKRHPEAVFDIVGPLDSSIESMQTSFIDEAQKDGIIEYHGATKDVPLWLGKCRYFVYPSYYPEGVPRCVLQALSTGRPVITCTTPGCKVTVEDGVNGYKVAPRDPKALADRMLQMLENPEQAERMAKASRERAEKMFDVNKINQLLVSKLL